MANKQSLVARQLMSLKCLKVSEQKALTGGDFKRLFDAALNKLSHKKSNMKNK